MTDFKTELKLSVLVECWLYNW